MAFPTTPILDDFAGSNENPIATNWAGPWFGAEDELQLLSNQITTDTAPGNSYWDVETFGPDCEAYITIPTIQGDGQNVGLGVRLVDLGANVDGYIIFWVRVDPSSDFVRVNRLDNGAPTALGADMSQALTAGDKLGMQIVGSDINVYVDTGSGWTLLGTRTDSTYTAAGNIGVRFSDGVAIGDDFGGGTISGGLYHQYYNRMIAGGGTL